MIPIRLELTNFLSYRETTVLDFDGLDLACIAGHNGAGKSSLLDAITWALFGKSRSKSDDDIVNRRASTGQVRWSARVTIASSATDAMAVQVCRPTAAQPAVGCHTAPRAAYRA